jgi:putative SOS response-associated peptidase YedK
MCGRFTLTAPADVVADHYQLSLIPLLAPRYNIAPTQPVAAVRLDQAGGREWTHFRWGLVPSWARDLSIGSKMINARSETAAEKQSFRTAFKRRRCLIPATGFYEWQKRDGRKQPMYIQPVDGLMSFAGLWEIWSSADGDVLETCTILTTEPNELMAPIHNRMPVILDPEDYSAWLDPQSGPDLLMHLLRPAPAERLVAFPVSTAVNSPANDGPDCIEPLAA